MNAGQAPSRRNRLILDGSLVLLLILLLCANGALVQAKRALPLAAQASATIETTAIPDHDLSIATPESDNPAPATVLLDNTTLAAVSAALMAALTPPQYLLDLPVITR
jgi:hypothetical protein